MRRKAFTLVELLVVIAIIGLLSTIAVVSLGTARTKAKAAKVVADLRQMNTALQMYYQDNGGYSCFDHLWDDARETTWSAPYVKWPRTPWGTHYHFEYALPAIVPNIYSISIEGVPADVGAAMAAMSPGAFYGTSGRVEWTGMEQNVPVPIPEACP